MNIFIRKSIIFLIIPLGLIIILFLTLNFINIKVTKKYKIDSKINSIFIGDSHIRQSINDSIFSKGINLSENSESFYFSFYKLKAIIPQNRSIKTIYLGFSFHNLSSYNNDFIFGKESFFVSDKYFYILPIEEKIHLLECNYSKLPSYIINILKIGIENILINKNLSYLGNYENKYLNTSANQKSIDKRLLYQFYENNKLNIFSELNIRYLYKIINLCKTKKIDLVILNTPLHHYYKNKIPFEYIQKYNEIIIQNHLKVLDFNNLRLDDDSFMPDGDHVSQKGAIQTTKSLIKNISE